MRRKYDLRNKRNFVIILLLSIVIIGIFSLFIYKYKKASRIEYNIPVGSVIQDVNKNYIDISEDATLKMRWNGSYYLIYQDKRVNLGKKVIVYNTISNGIKLYGKFYEIDATGKVDTLENETVLSNTTDARFYKLDDREYLLVDRKIVSADNSIEATDYLFVELDKLGNAKLSNNKINLKTINPTTLVTSKYSFDIAKEILKYGKLEIDLKKIIGSTNQYKEEEMEDTKEENKKGKDTTATTTTNTEETITNKNGNKMGDDIDIDELINKTKMTSIIRVSEGLTQIDVDYVVYDPYNEYQTVYAEVVKPNKVDVIHLSKTDTHVVIDNLSANTEYKINFIYTTVDSETNELINHKFDDMVLKTKLPVYDIEPVKISGVTKMITYRVILQKNYSISNVKVKLTFDYDEINEVTGDVTPRTATLNQTLNVSSSQSSVVGSFDISDYSIDNNTNLKLTVVSVSGNDGTISINKTKGFVFGG